MDHLGGWLAHAVRAMLAAMGYDALTPESFQKLGDRDAELFVRELIQHELAERHADGWRLDGPAALHTGGPDLEVALAAAPTVSRAAFTAQYRTEALTFDEVGVPVVYSVKSGMTGKKHALAEAKTGLASAVAALEAGGRVVIVLTRPKQDAPSPVRKATAKKKAGAKKTAGAQATPPALSFTEQLKAAYKDRLKQGSGHLPDPSARVHVVDCNDLLFYLRGARPALSQGFLELLGIPLMPGLLSVDGWIVDHERDRGTPAFVWDAERHARKQQIVDALRAPAPAQQTIWLVSAPGVGKTRLVVEAVKSDDAIKARTYAATEPALALRAVRELGLFSHYRDAILIVDDCGESEVAELARAFQQQHGRGAQARLFMITPHAPAALTAQAPRDLARLELPPLEDVAVRTLIAREAQLDEADAMVATVADRTEGYPWFAILVARALAGVVVLPPTWSVSDAVDLALAPRGADHAEQIRRRGAALMAVMLLDGEDLGHLRAEDRTEIAALFPDAVEGWTALRHAIDRCTERGLVRPGAGGIYRYVTPAVLELEIARRFLGPDPGDGPPRRGVPPDASQPMRDRFDRLLARLETLGFTDEDLGVLADPFVRRLEAAPAGLGALAQISGAELEFAAAHRPAAISRELRRHLRAATLDEIRADRAHRRSLVYAFQAATSRRNAFTDAEEGLLRLARGENEQYANNATQTWAALFDIELNQTYLPPTDRLALLEQRLTSDEPDIRTLGVIALGRALSIHGFKVAIEPKDGPFPELTSSAARRAREAAWRLLARVIREGDDAVVQAAAAIAARELRGAARSYVLATAAGNLATSLDRVAEASMRKIREAAALANRHDRHFIKRDSETEDAWSRLMLALEPQSFRDRLRQRVGAWGPVELRAEESLDRALAQEGLSQLETLRSELEWLTSRDAVRSIPFAIALGMEDTESRILSLVLERASSSPDFVGGYLRGHVTAGRADIADRAIASMRTDPSLADAAATAIWRVRASPQRVSWLIADLRARRLAERTISFLPVGGFFREIADEQFEEIVGALLECGTPAAATVAVDAIVDRLDHASEKRAPLIALLERGFSRAGDETMNGHDAHTWQVAANALLAAGRVEVVLTRALTSVGATKSRLPPHEVIEILRELAKVAPVPLCDGIRAGLDDATRRESFILAAREARLMEASPPEPWLDWVGQDDARGVMIARATAIHDGPTLPALARSLIVRLGADSRTSRVIATELQATYRAVSSLSEFARATIARLAPWTHDADAEVRRFASSATREVKAAHDFYAAREEHTKRRHGS